IESRRVFLVDWIQAGAGVGCADVTMALQGNAKLLLGRRAIGACPGIMNSRDAAAVWRYDAEQFHDEQLQRREGSAAGAVEISAHRLLKRCSHSRVAAVFRQARHDPEDRVAPLAE